MKLKDYLLETPNRPVDRALSHLRKIIIHAEDMVDGISANSRSFDTDEFNHIMIDLVKDDSEHLSAKINTAYTKAKKDMLEALESLKKLKDVLESI